MMRPSVDSQATSSPPAFWRERMFWFVVLAWCGLFVTRLTTLTIRGEESRRALVAHEMIESGDWFVPRQQARPFVDRPPFHEWMIALSSSAAGEMSRAAIRVPAILGVLLTAVMIFCFTRRFLSPYGAAAAAIVFLTFGQVLQLGRLAESEGVFVGALTAAIFGWHSGYRSGRPAWQTWCWTYAWAAAATLTKGPQGAVYIFSAIGLYLLLQRDWRYLISFGHAAGLALFALLFGSWFIGCGLTESFAVARGTVFAMVNMRLANRGSLPLHMLQYPFHLLAALLPWAPLLLRYLWPGFRAELGRARDGVVFCTAALAATFPSVWWTIGALSRHYLCMYPCLAVLIGVVLERSFAAAPTTSLAVGWRWFCRTLAAATLGGAVFIFVVPWIDADWAIRLKQPLWFVALFVITAVAAVVVMMRSLRRPVYGATALPIRFAGFATLIVMIGVAYVGLALNIMSGMANENAGPIVAVKQLLPPGAKLVSFGELEHIFPFHYRDPIRVLPLPQSPNDIPPDVEYFSYAPEPNPTFRVPGEWEQVAVVSCERNIQTNPRRTVVIGRVIRSSTTSVAEKLRDLR